jgi:hypothetical protein
MACTFALAIAVTALAAGAVATARAGGAAPDVRRPKKLIAVGWDLAGLDTRALRDRRDEMESRPFDGITVYATGRRDDGKPCPLHWAFLREPWKYEWFAGAVDDCKACRFQRLTDNFLVVLANPGDVDWFDDPGWAAIVEHWRIAARVARDAGLKGIAFDPEPYAPPHAPFQYAAQTGRGQRTFDEYAAKVRQRGREVMGAIAAEYPDLALLCFFMDSICAGATGHADPGPLLAGEGYGLLPAFVDGWLDAAPPGVTMVDGHESAYLYNSDVAFLEAANLIRGACQELVSPANRAKYRAQVQVGFGIYLDAYVNPPGSPWYVDGLGGPRVERLRANVRAAVRAADEYVWIYGEKCRWWPTANKSVTEKTWPEVLPGCEDALRFARSPEEWARWKIGELARAGALKNLVVNGDFSAAKGGAAPAAVAPEPAAGAPEPAAEAAGHPDREKVALAADWTTWQDDKSKGVFLLDLDAGASGKGAARLAGMADGCFIQKFKVEPGRHLAVEAVRRLRGRGDAVLVVRWQTAGEKWIHEDRDVHVASADPRGAWGRLFGVVEVPEGAGQLVILLLARGQESPDDVAWFDDVRLYALD